MLLFSILALTGCAGSALEDSEHYRVPYNEPIATDDIQQEIIPDTDEVHEEEKDNCGDEEGSINDINDDEESDLHPGTHEDTLDDDDSESLVYDVLDSLQPAIMVDGELFIAFSMTYKFPINLDEAKIDGNITSSVSLSEWPSIDDQTNLDGLLGAKYIIYGEDIALFWDINTFQRWVLFRNAKFFD